MSPPATGKTPWLRYGCLGCLGLVVFVLLAGGGIVGLAWYQAGQTEMSETSATPDLPTAPLERLQEPVAGAEGISARPEPAGGEEDLPTAGLVPLAAGLPTAAAGRVRLDLAQARFEILPGRPGERLHVEATYDKTSYILEESLDTGDRGPEGDEPAWTYSIGFRRTRGAGFMTALREMVGGTRPTVRVVLPPDIPLILDMNLQQGETSMDLGGLWLRRADLRFSQGGFELRVPEPLREPMQSLRIDGSMGSVMISDLGNASPRRLELEFSMGGLVLDLTGAWVADSDIDITSSMGGTVVRLPRNVILEGVPVEGLAADPAAEIQPPRLRFRTSSSMGEIEFQR